MGVPGRLRQGGGDRWVRRIADFSRRVANTAMRRRQVSDPRRRLYFMSMVASTKRAMSRTRRRLRLPDAEGNGPGALPKRDSGIDGSFPRPVAAGEAHRVPPGRCRRRCPSWKRGVCQIRAGPILGILCGFPSGRISGEDRPHFESQRGIEPAVATNGCYKCGRPVGCQVFEIISILELGLESFPLRHYGLLQINRLERSRPARSG